MWCSDMCCIVQSACCKSAHALEGMSHKKLEAIRLQSFFNETISVIASGNFLSSSELGVFCAPIVRQSCQLLEKKEGPLVFYT